MKNQTNENRYHNTGTVAPARHVHTTAKTRARRDVLYHGIEIALREIRFPAQERCVVLLGMCPADVHIQENQAAV